MVSFCKQQQQQPMSMMETVTQNTHSLGPFVSKRVVKPWLKLQRSLIFSKNERFSTQSDAFLGSVFCDLYSCHLPLLILRSSSKESGKDELINTVLRMRRRFRFVRNSCLLQIPPLSKSQGRGEKEMCVDDGLETLHSVQIFSLLFHRGETCSTLVAGFSWPSKEEEKNLKNRNHDPGYSRSRISTPSSLDQKQSQISSLVPSGRTSYLSRVSVLSFAFCHLIL